MHLNIYLCVLQRINTGSYPPLCDAETEKPDRWIGHWWFLSIQQGHLPFYVLAGGRCIRALNDPYHAQLRTGCCVIFSLWKGPSTLLLTASHNIIALHHTEGRNGRDQYYKGDWTTNILVYSNVVPPVRMNRLSIALSHSLNLVLHSSFGKINIQGPFPHACTPAVRLR